METKFKSAYINLFHIHLMPDLLHVSHEVYLKTIDLVDRKDYNAPLLQIYTLGIKPFCDHLTAHLLHCFSGEDSRLCRKVIIDRKIGICIKPPTSVFMHSMFCRAFLLQHPCDRENPSVNRLLCNESCSSKNDAIHV